MVVKSLSDSTATGRLTRFLAAALLLTATPLAWCKPYTQWGDWSTGSWRAASQDGSATVRIESSPPGAMVFVGDTPRGRSPLALHLSYPLEQRVRERTLYRHHPRRTAKALGGVVRLATLGIIPCRPQARHVPLDTETDRDLRASSARYAVYVAAPGHYSRCITVNVPEDDGRAFHAYLTRRENLIIAPVAAEPQIRRETGPLRWLRDRVFARNAIRADDYFLLAERITDSLRDCIAERGVFASVQVEDGQPNGGEALLRIRVVMGADEVVMEGRLASGSIRRGGTVTRRVRVEERALLQELQTTCETLAGELMRAYLSGCGFSDE